jgi:hypothetical protein
MFAHVLFIFQIMTEVLRAFYGNENVRRAPGLSGQLKR